MLLSCLPPILHVVNADEDCAQQLRATSLLQSNFLAVATFAILALRFFYIFRGCHSRDSGISIFTFGRLPQSQYIKGITIVTFLAVATIAILALRFLHFRGCHSRNSGISISTFLEVAARVARWHIFKPKIGILKGLAMEDVVIFYDICLFYGN
jgi:ABC-type uncharacterized transport system YnjBCD permease subunit